MKDLIEAINANPKWTDSTKKSRIAILNFIKKDLKNDKNGFDFLKDHKLIEKYIKDNNKNPNTAQSKLLTIKNCLALVDQKASLKYDKLATDLQDAITEYRDNNTTIPEKLLTMKEMVEIPYRLENTIKYIYGDVFLTKDQLKELKTQKNINKYMRYLTDYVISVFYLWQPPIRSELSILQFQKSDNLNWYDPKNNTVYYNDFKNVKSFGKRSFVLDKRISDVLNNYIKVLKVVVKDPKRLIYIWQTKDNIQFSRSSFCSYFRNLMKKLTGNVLTLNNFRHSYETSIISNPKYNNLTIGQKRAIHERLLHRWQTAQEYMQVPTKSTKPSIDLEEIVGDETKEK